MICMAHAILSSPVADGGGGPCEAWWRGRPHTPNAGSPPPPPIGGPPPPCCAQGRNLTANSVQTRIIAFDRFGIDRRVGRLAQLFVAAAARLHVGDEDGLGMQRHFLGHLDRDDHEAVVVAADDVAGTYLRPAD